jgi:hypothetical protein
MNYKSKDKVRRISSLFWLGGAGRLRQAAALSFSGFFENTPGADFSPKILAKGTHVNRLNRPRRPLEKTSRSRGETKGTCILVKK